MIRALERMVPRRLRPLFIMVPLAVASPVACSHVQAPASSANRMLITEAMDELAPDAGASRRDICGAPPETALSQPLFLPMVEPVPTADQPPPPPRPQ